MRRTALTLGLVVLASACSSRVPTRNPLVGKTEIKIVPADRGLGAVSIEVDQEWHYSVLWLGELPVYPVAVVELIDGEIFRYGGFTPSARISSWPKGLVISKQYYYKKAGAGQRQGEWLEPNMDLPPIEGEGSADLTVRIELKVFELIDTGLEYKPGRFVASDKRTLKLSCLSCSI